MTPPRCTRQQHEKFSAKKDKQEWPHVKRITITADMPTTHGIVMKLPHLTAQKVTLFSSRSVFF
jgi:hypothetical protein